MGETLWKVGGRIVDLSRHGMIMGVLNVTPDSFSERGKFFNSESAVARGVQMAAEGAQIVDVGGESTRPGAEPVSAEEELRRVVPVIEELKAKIDIVISIDTSKSEVAKAALGAGASVINDVTGGRGDEKMLQLAQHYVDLVSEVTDFFLQQHARALECGIDPMAIAFDPGMGFGKTLEHNLELIGKLGALRVQERPLVVGVSRKAFLGKLVGSSAMSDRLAPTVALTSLLRSRGANIIRVHDVKENVDALRVTEAVLQ